MFNLPAVALYPDCDVLEVLRNSSTETGTSKCFDHIFHVLSLHSDVALDLDGIGISCLPRIQVNRELATREPGYLTCFGYHCLFSASQFIWAETETTQSNENPNYCLLKILS